MRDIDGDLAVSVQTCCSSTLPFAGIYCLEVEGVEVSDEESYGDDQAEYPNDDAESEHAFECFEGEPGFIADVVEGF